MIIMRCDLCGTFSTPGSEIHALVADSSAVYGQDPLLDGRRILTACSPTHLSELQRRCRERPFVDVELWANKVTLALQRHPEGLSTQQLAEKTGLTASQVEHGITWRQENHPAPPPIEPAD
ncbi:hypothetical protein ACFY8P_26205 [Streptomyces sp. NPDC012693]|uniref:hypothetical protein n=1 Tax=Streptomyces sp. NPDC012693 TaxID=3364844 RepID=UPI003684FD1E